MVKVGDKFIIIDSETLIDKSLVGVQGYCTVPFSELGGDSFWGIFTDRDNVEHEEMMRPKDVKFIKKFNENFKTCEEEEYGLDTYLWDRWDKGEVHVDKQHLIAKVSKKKIRIVHRFGKSKSESTHLTVIVNDKNELEVYDWWGWGGQ